MPAEVLLTAAAVAGIVSLFQGSAALYNSWESRREAQQRSEADAARQGETENSLALGRTRVQGEYDRHFARMGPRFARGDDIGRLQLMAEHIALQQTVIRCL
nr:hypothetical protein B0A51_07177 [Rachicladosporium sp. CCFEE 5018]